MDYLQVALELSSQDLMSGISQYGGNVAEFVLLHLRTIHDGRHILRLGHLGKQSHIECHIDTRDLGMINIIFLITHRQSLADYETMGSRHAKGPASSPIGARDTMVFRFYPSCVSV